ncbi:MAG: tetratricopeptide repeat protein, partial [Spirochaetia bacterium]|nr:tetratricopeptide repeat protein [Spirochaetia bacterium]
YRNTGDYKTAADYYRRAMDIDFDIYAALGLSLICKGEGKYDEAIERLEQLINNDQKNYRLYIDLADCYVKKNDPQMAIKTLQRFQKLGIRSQAINEYLDQIQKM